MTWSVGYPGNHILPNESQQLSFNYRFVLDCQTDHLENSKCRSIYLHSTAEFKLCKRNEITSNENGKGIIQSTMKTKPSFILLNIYCARWAEYFLDWIMQIMVIVVPDWLDTLENTEEGVFVKRLFSRFAL